MGRYCERKNIIWAEQWFKMGGYFGKESILVRPYQGQLPDVEVTEICRNCNESFSEHGWIQYKDSYNYRDIAGDKVTGQLVHSGDYIMVTKGAYGEGNIDGPKHMENWHVQAVDPVWFENDYEEIE
jgi:hypothetical protein